MTDAEIRSKPFSLRKADYAAFYLSTYFRGFVAFPKALVIWLVAFAAAAAVAFGDLARGQYLQAILILLAVVAVWFGVIPALGLASMMRTLSRTRHSYLPRVAIVSDAMLAIEGDGFADRRAWSQFKRLRVTSGCLYLMVTSGSAMIVPASAFAGPAERDLFIAACRRHITGSADHHAQVFETPMVSAPLQGEQEAPPHRLGFRVWAALYLFALIRGLLRPTVWLIAAGIAGFTAWTHRDRIAAGDLSSLILAAGAMGVWLLIFLPLMTFLAWRTARTKPALRSERRLSISPAQVRVHGEGFDIALGWPVIRRIDRRFGAIQFWTGEAASLALPLSAFASPDAAQAFQNQAIAWWQAGHNAPPKV